MPRGRIKFYDRRRAYGFVSVQSEKDGDREEDAFLHHLDTGLPHDEHPEVGQECEFEVRVGKTS